MPWSPKEASAKTSKANTPAKRKQWAEVANKVLQETGDDAKAITVASGVVKNHPARHMHGDGAPGSHWSRK